MLNRITLFVLFFMACAANAMEETPSITNKNSILCATFDGDLEKVCACIKQKQDVNAKDDTENTALMYASEYGRIEIVKALIKAGAGVNDYNKNWKTPLMCAAMGSHLAVIDELMKAGADAKMNTTNIDGYTALGLAKRWGSTETEVLLRCYGAKESWCVIS